VRATIQLCTYNRAALLGRVLDACFEQQQLPFDAYEVVLVNDGSRDETPAVIAAARGRATCALTVIDQANAGLARARNAGIARSRGERIIFIDDDVLVTPFFVAEHLRSHERTPAAVVRGGVINTASFDALPPPMWSLGNYSGNFFWTTNVSVARSRLDAVGHFTESFREYGWEDIELGLRLRKAGARSLLNPRALAYHHKPPTRASGVDKMIAQARAQARTARQLSAMHPHWRVVLATGDHPLLIAAHEVFARLQSPARLARRVGERATERVLTARERGAARALASIAYYDELMRRATD
jgi:GT2 family glycosyltransferase